MGKTEKNELDGERRIDAKPSHFLIRRLLEFAVKIRVPKPIASEPTRSRPESRVSQFND
jgi:hypothetical protein